MVMNESLFRILHAGVEVATSREYFFNNETRPNPDGTMVIQRTLEGTGLIEREGREFLVSKDRAMVFCYGENSCYSIAPGCDKYRFDYLGFCGEAGRSAFAELVDSCGPVIDLSPGTEGTLKFDALLARYMAKAFRDRYEMSAMTYEVIMSLLRQRSEVGAQSVAEMVAWEWIQSEFERPFNIKELASRLGVSREHLPRRFNKAFGLSPGSLLSRLRLEKGRSMVLGTGLDLETISNACGFADGNTFCRSYRTYWGTSPIKDRRSQMLTGRDGVDG